MRLCLFPRAKLGAVVALTAIAAGCSNGEENGACTPNDADGIQGGVTTLQATVDDTHFMPSILKAQNLAKITLTLTNAGSKPHDLVFGCIATPNDNGCPTTSCFDGAAAIPSVAPGASATSAFVTPNPEGIYSFRSDLAGDAQTGQFIVQ